MKDLIHEITPDLFITVHMYEQPKEIGLQTINE